MRRSMYDIVMERLDAENGNLRTVARDAGVRYDWLLKVRQRRIKSPSVHHIQSLYDFFYPPARA